MFSLTNVIQIIIIFQGVLLTLYILFSRRKKSMSDFILASIIGTLSVQIIGLFLANRNFEPNFFQGANCIYGFLYGPLLFYYNRSITLADFKFRWIDLAHLLPALTILIVVLATNGTICQPKLSIGYAMHIMTYVFICFLEIRRYKKVIGDNYSRLEWLNLGWLQWTFLVFSVIVLADVIQFLSYFFNFNTPQLSNLVFLLILAAINLLYFYGFAPSRRSVGFNKEDLAFSTSISSRKKLNTSLKENLLLIENLEAHIHSRESFRNSNLTIAMLAQELDIQKRTLSELINDHYGQNFVDFINTHRINLAKKKLKHPTDTNETILEVLFEVGFNSKSSFNSAFKKKTGLTPSEFKLKHQ